MSSVSFSLQQAIFAALSGSIDLQALIGDPPRLFDFVPPDSAFPYVVLGGGSEADWSTATEEGTEHAIQIDVWSRETGHKQAKQIAEVIRATLNNAALTVSGAVLIDIRHLSTDFSREPDGQTFRARLTFRAVTEP
ncbi:MAG TPA: DUF3168 domain-containing protein [Rhizomicrobium sp.]|jgi:hypothetical protein|nr:DUF3168 domain-containing protein [Rhizomicrobium sp.]